MKAVLIVSIALIAVAIFCSIIAHNMIQANKALEAYIAECHNKGGQLVSSIDKDGTIVIQCEMLPQG